MIPQRTFLQKNIDQINTQQIELHTRRALPVVAILVFVLMILASLGVEANEKRPSSLPGNATLSTQSLTR